MLPTNVMGSIMGLKKQAWFEAPEEERKNVDVKGLLDSQ
jgi:hypothetical protein